MLKFYTYNTINGQAVAIALKEMGIEHETVVVDLMKGGGHQPDFLKINPSGRIPVIVDSVENQPLVISQVGAILLYLADKTKTFLPENSVQKAAVHEWLMFQLTDISTNVFNEFLFRSLIKPAQSEAADILQKRVVKFYQLFEQQLSSHKYLIGDEITIADFATYPVIDRLFKANILQNVPHIKRWYDLLSERSSIQSVMGTNAQ